MTEKRDEVWWSLTSMKKKNQIIKVQKYLTINYITHNS